MRVLTFAWEYPPHSVGGMGKHVCELAPALAAAGVEVHIVTPDICGGDAQEAPARGVTVYRVAVPSPTDGHGGVVTFAQLANAALERQARALHARLGGFDLVHAHDWLVAYSAVALKYAARVPLLATVHATERGRGQGHLDGEQSLAINGAEWWLTYEAWRVITVSRFMAHQVHDYFTVPYDKIDVIYNGVTPPVARMSAAEGQSFRRRFAADGEPIAFCVGRVVHEKGVHILIDAAPEVLAEYGIVKFVVAGAGSQLEALRQRAYDRGLQDRFFFTGYIADEDRDRLYQVADVAVFPSLYEPFGIVALEAMAYHCPVVVAATGGLAEVVTLHETGMTSHPGSPESLAWALIETLRRPDWARMRAANAFHALEERYTWPKIAQETLNVYRRVQQEWRRSHWAQPRYEHTV